MNLGLKFAENLDNEDELKQFRDEFYIPNETIYFDGNSLGLLSKRSEDSLLNLLHSWKQYAIDGWSDGDNAWFYLSERLGDMMAPLLGAEPNEVIVTGSTTTNLHQLTASFFSPNEQKMKIVADELNFPSDIYALKSQLKLRGLDPNENLVRVKSRDGHTLETDDIIAAMKEDVALVVLPSVLYRSGQILDIKTITEEAHKRGVYVGFDLCHSIGAIPHKLSEWGVDFAFWCTYKHLNGGPGSVGGIYVNQKHFGKTPGLAGWFSSDKMKQFDMEHSLTIASDAGAYQIGTPHILSAAPLIGSLEIFQEATIEKVRKKSLALTDYLIDLVEGKLTSYEFKIVTPRNKVSRGAHVFLEHPEAARICKALKANKVIPDFRAPNGIRLAPVALYNTFQEVWHAVSILEKIMETEEYKKFENVRSVIA